MENETKTRTCDSLSYDKKDTKKSEISRDMECKFSKSRRLGAEVNK